MLTKIAGDCKGAEECPTIYDTGGDMLYVQGVPIADLEGKAIPDGEGVVAVSKAMVLEAARALA